MINLRQSVKLSLSLLAFLGALAMSGFGAPSDKAATSPEQAEFNGAGTLATIRGVVKDEFGSPIADATVAIFKLGTNKLLKQVDTTANGAYVLKMLPGTYTILAVAEGFNPETLDSVKVNSSADINFGFKLVKSGAGNTLPEKRVDHNSSKWRIRAAAIGRSIYQNQEGKAPVEQKTETAEMAEADPKTAARPTGVVETYFASDKRGAYSGINFATLLPVNSRTDVVVAGQFAPGSRTAKRIESILRFRANSRHQFSVKGSAASLGHVQLNGRERTLGQYSISGFDEWKVRDGVILVLGFDYSTFAGAGSDSSLMPRVGVQLDVDSKTRFRAGFTSSNDQRAWSNVAQFEGFSVPFTEPVSVEDIVVEDNKPRMNRSARLEFGIERVLDNASSIEATVFGDTSFSRGVGLARLPFATLEDDGFDGFVSNQRGQAAGVRVVYSRRLSSKLQASTGYSFGTGQKLSPRAITDPSRVFDNGLFQTLFAELTADLSTGTRVQAIYRLSPDATIFAIDPFKGRLAIYDPGLSILLTQPLPRFGLPVHAKAIIDARNIFDSQTSLATGEGRLLLDGQGRLIRGGIMVRF
ncbi:MAG: carboxypeptidase regulatory-like domain-containing protein [Acidobacteria bacterium]|nr:carboxypeptidase regulatory-like domain-containing protein [Acidobacteriota bacterium]